MQCCGITQVGDFSADNHGQVSSQLPVKLFIGKPKSFFQAFRSHHCPPLAWFSVSLLS